MRLLITAGPTREPIDQVRYLSNRSSGRLGLALTDAAQSAGHQVTLLLGPTCLTAPSRCAVHYFQSTADLQSLLARHFPHCDVLIMAAAVADYRPVATDPGKLPRAAAFGSFTLTLTPTPDLVADLAAHKTASQKIIAFALEEPAHLETRAMEKLRRKKVDAIVANPLATMGSDHIKPLLLTAAGDRYQPGPSDKYSFAQWLISRISAL